MTLRHLSVFIKVAELMSISKTAEELHIAQPSVSQTIKELESYYNVVLFDRIGKRLQITPEGLTLLQEAKDVVKEFEQFETIAKKEDLNTDIRIGGTTSFGSFVLSSFNKRIHDEIPNANPMYKIDTPESLQEKLLTGDLDFALEEGIINSKLLKSVRIGEDELIAICSPTFDAPESMKLEELANYNLLVLEQGNPSRILFENALLSRGIKLKTPLLEGISYSVILSMAMDGVGIGIIPLPIARRYLANGAIRRITLDISLKRTLFLVSHKNKTFNKTCLKAYNIAKVFLEDLKASRKIN